MSEQKALFLRLADGESIEAMQELLPTSHW
jgi:hypothetical protein